LVDEGKLFIKKKSEPILFGLIKLYASRTASDVTPEVISSSSISDKSWKEVIIENPLHARSAQTVNELKNILDKNFLINDADSQKSEIIAYINLLVAQISNPNAKENKIKILHDLILWKSKNWTKEQKDFFSFTFDVIKNWNTCFLSYANDAREVNEKFKKSIDIVIAKKWRESRNLLIEVIEKYLKNDHGFKVYRDVNRLENGDNFAKELEISCKKSIFLIQLIQRNSFIKVGKYYNPVIKEVESRSWSFWEYDIFKNNKSYWLDKIKKNRIKFLIAEEEVLEIPCKIAIHQEWNNEVKRIINHTKLSNKKNKLKKTIDEIASEISEAKKLFLISVPE